VGAAVKAGQSSAEARSRHGPTTTRLVSGICRRVRYGRPGSLRATAIVTVSLCERPFARPRSGGGAAAGGGGQTQQTRAYDREQRQQPPPAQRGGSTGSPRSPAGRFKRIRCQCTSYHGTSGPVRTCGRELHRWICMGWVLRSPKDGG
jgi:hypothetical protein